MNWIYLWRLIKTEKDASSRLHKGSTVQTFHFIVNTFFFYLHCAIYSEMRMVFVCTSTRNWIEKYYTEQPHQSSYPVRLFWAFLNYFFTWKLAHIVRIGISIFSTKKNRFDCRRTHCDEFFQQIEQSWIWKKKCIDFFTFFVFFRSHIEITNENIDVLKWNTAVFVV